LSNRKKDRRSRSRKPRPNTASSPSQPLATEPPEGQAPKKRKAHDAESSHGGGQAKAERARGAKNRKTSTQSSDPNGRPQALWHPLPLSEILILAGVLGTVIGLRRLGHGGISSGGPPLFAGIGAVGLGTIEVMVREHLSGYRSHTIVLALIPLVVLDTPVALLIAPLTSLAKVVLLAIDLAVFALLFRFLRARFIDAHRERVFKGRR
jgi:hypothetical protein